MRADRRLVAAGAAAAVFFVMFFVAGCISQQPEQEDIPEAAGKDAVTIAADTPWETPAGEQEQNAAEENGEKETLHEPGEELSQEDMTQREKTPETDYYLVVARKEKIVIYYIDDFGAEQMIQQTEIPY